MLIVFLDTNLIQNEQNPFMTFSEVKQTYKRADNRKHSGDLLQLQQLKARTRTDLEMCLYILLFQF